MRQPRREDDPGAMRVPNAAMVFAAGPSKLSPYSGDSGSFDARWKLRINTKVEPDA